MTHISLDTILEWEKRESVHTFDVLDKEYFDVELKRYPPEMTERDSDPTHDMDELYYIISGSGTVSVGDDTYAIDEGEMVFVEQGQNHDFVERNEELIVLKILAGP